MSDAAIDRMPGAVASPKASRALAFALCAFTAVSCLLLLVAGELLNDPDSHWHIAIGRWIVENRAFPRTDLWSHTAAGQSWIAKEWLSQVLLHAAHHLAGWRGVTLLAILAAAGSMAMIAGWLALRLRATLVVGVLALILALASPSIMARPHVLALLLLTLWTLGLLTALERRTTPPWWLLGVMVIWANAHAGFTIGFVIAGLLGLEAVRKAGAAWFHTGLQWAAFLLLALACSCLTPYGAEAYLVTFKLFGSGEPLGYLTEWQPLERDMAGLAAMGLLAVLLLGLGANPWRNLMRIILIAILGWMMLRYSRFALVFAFTAPLIAATPLAQRFAGLAAEVADGATARMLPFLAAGAAVILIAVALVAPAPLPSPRSTPAPALSAARAAGLKGPVYNDYNFGGYLISQGVPTFVDGRTDQLFLGGFLTALERARTSPSPEALLVLLQSRQATWALVATGQAEAGLLDRAGWRTIYRDSVATVLAAPGP
ncbi:MAG: hypothetical protein NTZ14_10385 [Hyphomicrobiales bacterium]|nr:hypothetical protein [Hyphomicrobiales bacterium]